MLFSFYINHVQIKFLVDTSLEMHISCRGMYIERSVIFWYKSMIVGPKKVFEYI